MPVTAHEDVVEHAHVHEDAQVLEGASHSQAGGIGRVQLGQFGVPEPYAAAGHLLQPADGVEQRGLAGAVRTDEGGDAAFLDLQGDFAHGLQAAEVDGHVLHPQERSRLHASRSSAEPGLPATARRSCGPGGAESLPPPQPARRTGIAGDSSSAGRGLARSRLLLKRLTLDLAPTGAAPSPAAGPGYRPAGTGAAGS